jgi:hypothetical protein
MNLNVPLNSLAATTGTATATAQANALFSSSALADAYATGWAGSSSATATSSGGTILNVTASAAAPVSSPGSAVHTEAFATTGGQTRNDSFAAGIQAATFATALPSNADAIAALAASPAVLANFDVGGTGRGPASNVFGLMTMSSGDMALGSSTAYHSQIDWSINISTLADQQNLLIGLLGAGYSGSGLVTFSINQNGNTIGELDAASFANAQSFFNDHTLNLGAIASGVGGNGDLTLGFTLNITPTSAGATFDPNFIFGNATPGSGSAKTPEPSTLCLLGFGAMALLGRKRLSAGRHHAHHLTMGE